MKKLILSASDQDALVEREPLRIHKGLVIQVLRSHPEDREKLIPDWPGTVEEYIAELERRPGEFFVDGRLEE